MRSYYIQLASRLHKGSILEIVLTWCIPTGHTDLGEPNLFFDGMGY